jgi:protein translocase SecG subunit
MDIPKFLMYGLQFLSGLSLIVLVAMQTGRHEGLGSMGGGSAPVQRGRAGIDEKLAEFTKYAALAFMILSLLLFFLAKKWHW